MPKLKLAKNSKTTTAALPFKVEKGIPIASPVHNRVWALNPYQDQFLAMDPSRNPPDSFLIVKDKKKYAKVNYHAKKWGKLNNATFVFRNTEQGYRCWRIK